VDALSYKTISANDATVDKKWLLVDAQDQVLGRLASRVAIVLRGKHKPSFTPHVDCGDNIVIINAEKINLTGTKTQEKVYTRHTGYPGGQRFTTPVELLNKNPEEIIEHAVKRMLPRNRLGREIFKNLHVYKGGQHPHEAQQPKEFNLDIIK
jgi:large subunit ribosomal protein L13